MQTVRLGRVLLVAAVSALVPLAGNVVAALLTDWTGRAGWLVVPAVGVVVAMITALVEAYGGTGSDASSHPRDHADVPGEAHAKSSPPQERRRTPLVVALLIAVVVIGIGGLVVAEGTRVLVTESDLPEGYKLVHRDRSSSLDTCARIVVGSPPLTRLKKKLPALGFKSCERTEYRKTVGDRTASSTTGAVSLSFVLRDDQAASELLPVLRTLILTHSRPTGEASDFQRHSVPAPDLGDEAPRGLALSVRDPDGGKLTAWVYLWRRGNVVALVGSSDAVGDFDRLSTLELARAVDARLAD